MLEGQRLKVSCGPWRMCKKSFVCWACGQEVYDRLRFDSDAYANLHLVVVTNEVKRNKSKGFKFFDKCFYSFEQTKYWGVRLTFKLLKNIEKSAWLKACSCTPTGTSSWLLVRYLNFLREFPKAVAWWEIFGHWMKTCTWNIHTTKGKSPSRLPGNQWTDNTH